jgi:hypothetical protein
MTSRAEGNQQLLGEIRFEKVRQAMMEDPSRQPFRGGGDRMAT